jgi:hypothetical protein
VSNLERRSGASIAALRRPRLHREEGDRKIIGTPRREIKWCFRRGEIEVLDLSRA